jgi:NitT/TauT family transport system substrate-binding protein
MRPGQPVRIGYLSTMYHTSFLLQGTPFLKDRGLSATWTLFASGPDIVNAMRDHRVDLGYIGLPPVIIGIDRGLGLTCIAGGHIEGTVMIAGEEARSLGECSGMRGFLSQFSGKTIGTPPKGSIHDVIVNELIREYGIADISVKNYPWADLLPDALSEGEIAAAAGTPALAVAAERWGRARIVVPPDRLWPFNPSYGIVVMRDMLSSPDLLSRFLSAHEAACEMIRHDPRTCSQIVARTTGMVDEAFVMETYRISPKYCAALATEYRASTMRFVHVLHALGYIARLIDEKEIFDLSLIEHVHPGPHHYESGIVGDTTSFHRS